MSPALLEVTDLCVHYPSRERRGVVRAVDGVSLRIEAGEALGLVGESGCGKSSLARALVGLEPQSAGSIKVAGMELVGLSRSNWRTMRRRVQIVFQDPYSSLDPRMTVGDILMEPLEIHRIGRRRERLGRAMGLLESVGLEANSLDRYPHEFSGGQRQRLAIARALALEPQLLVLDEPVSALDVSVRSQIVQLLRELRERYDLAYLFIAHDLALVRLVCERVAVMYLGRVVEAGPREEIYGDPLHPYTQGLLASVPVPDPVRARARARLAPLGEVPSPLHPPSGCHYHPRCPERGRVDQDRCMHERPRLVGPKHEGAVQVACHLHPFSGTAE